MSASKMAANGNYHSAVENDTDVRFSYLIEF